MSKMAWLKKGLAVKMRNLLFLCSHCPCIGFPGWIDPENKYLFYEYRDWDCCLLDKNIYVSEGGYSKVDGHVTFKWISRTSCEVVESTGSYAADYPVGSVFPLSDGYPSPFVMTSTIISDTRRLSPIRDSYCCNGNGQRIYAIMFNDDEEFE